MRYINLYKTQADYDAVKDSLDKSQVALIDNTMKVFYQPRNKRH